MADDVTVTSHDIGGVPEHAGVEMLPAPLRAPGVAVGEENVWNWA